jgi:hypothetical protein
MFKRTKREATAEQDHLFSKAFSEEISHHGDEETKEENNLPQFEDWKDCHRAVCKKPSSDH